MPPVRRASGGWLLRTISRGDDYSGDLVGGDYGRSLPDDALSPVLARLPTAADVVRCAATCRRWAAVVAKDAAVLSRTLTPPVQALTLGFFHQLEGAAEATPRKRRRLSDTTTAQPRFVPTAAAARLLGSLLHGAPSTTALGDAVLDNAWRSSQLLEHALPVAAHDGWLVVELRRERYTDGLTLCVCNPMTGELSMISSLSGSDKPGDYACALYTSAGGDHQRPFFRVLIVYNRRPSTVLRSYSSDTGRWSAEVNRSWGPKMTGEALGQSVVVRGVAYWPLRRTAFAVRVDTPEPVELRMPSRGIAHMPRGWRLLGVDPDDAEKLTSIDAGVCRDYLCLSIRATLRPGEDEEWKAAKPCIRLEQLKVHCPGDKVPPPFGETINLRWFCKKSGILLFTLGQGTGSPGAFALNMATEHLEKVADGLDCSLWTSFVGYEIDGATYLESILSPP
ncbi:LOW QUALITY PROTEIN: hypothetical protein U9M48_041784 [Paspalum notatum var. saurae]|uniref:F-box domain-containing protein n=1 Tax=Paspalum notatum var. saurae TaxID=547442 RepID=A0AAQ3XEJ8_PASNO